MPTGPAHVRVKRIEELIYEPLSDCEACRCMIGKDHDENGMTVSDYWYEQDEGGSGEALSEYEAADIWASSGGDEDYSFGYSNEERSSPPVDRGVIDRHAALGHHFFEVSIADAVTAVPPYRPQNDLAGEMTTREDTHNRDYFTPIFLTSALCNSTQESERLPIKNGEKSMGAGLPAHPDH